MRQRLVEHGHVKDSTSKKGYWNHVELHNRRNDEGEVLENKHANPDVINDESGNYMYQPDEATKEVQERVHKLLKLSKQILTQQQYNVFVLMAVKEPALTERETAKALSLSKTRVHTLWNAAREKLKVAYEQRTA